MGKLGAVGSIYRLMNGLKQEYGAEAECRDELLEGREEALENKEQCDETFKRHGAALCAYNELEDDNVFTEKAVECHRKNSRLRKALRGQ